MDELPSQKSSVLRICVLELCRSSSRSSSRFDTGIDIVSTRFKTADEIERDQPLLLFGELQPWSPPLLYITELLNIDNLLSLQSKPVQVSKNELLESWSASSLPESSISQIHVGLTSTGSLNTNSSTTISMAFSSCRKGCVTSSRGIWSACSESCTKSYSMT